MSSSEVVHLPATYPLNIKQGADRVLSLTFTDANDAPVNLTGYAACFTVRDRYGGSALLTLTESDGITLGGALGTVTINLTHAKTDTLAFNTGVYDCYIKSGASPAVYTYLIEGTFTVTPKVST